jgi:hypothetical protein
LQKRLSSNALFFTIILSLVIALLCSSLILIAYFHRARIQHNQLEERLVRNIQSAIALELASNDYKDSVKILDLYGEGKDSVWIGKTTWGLFEVTLVKAFSRGDTLARTYMAGSMPDSVWKAALYLLDQGRPVTFAGKTLVKGTAYLPEAGPTRGWVDGRNFEREKLVDGELKKSTSKLPSLNATFLAKLLKQVAINRKTPSTNNKVLQADSIVVAFDQPTLHVHSAGKPLRLGRILVKGNIILSSDTLIEVSTDTRLENVILTAPNITFGDNFKGSVQAFATDSILAGEGCYFSYPSSLTILEIDSVDNRPRLVLAKKCRLEGVVFQYVSFIDRSLALLDVREGATVTGQVYADGLTCLQGKVAGTLACNKFTLYRPSGVYENHLLDCEIDRSKLSRFFLGSPLFSSQQKGIAKWLD